ncbi:Na+/H+ antiporter NhaA [Georgenia halophila]|uniref:Na(+)/H(+) antiporter NhaA n=1 Tax=Georgenia halophila TaxID=620889 RepID=A0ABP8L3H7_9MICO
MPHREPHVHHHMPTESNRSRRKRIRMSLEDETFAGSLLLAGAVLALLWANSPWRDAYHSLADFHVGPESLHLDLALHTWAADGLLAIFFFVVGLELKTEFVTGSLRRINEALLPMIAAVLGMVTPAVFYTVIQLASGSGALHGWAIPTATDIAFAVALLGIFGKGLPPAARVFLLTLAVVDDLLAIIVIAMFYTAEIQFLPLLGALAIVAVFGVLVQRRMLQWWLLVPLGILAWGLMHASGVHATVAGVLLGMTVPAKMRHGDHHQVSHHFVEKVQPISAGFALPVFAFFAAGVTVIDTDVAELVTDPVVLGVVAGLVLGKVLGIWGGVAILVRTTRLRLGHGVDLPDLLGVAMLAGIGFTVSLLIAELSFASEESGNARFAVIFASVISAALAAFTLRARAKVRVRGRGSRVRWLEPDKRPDRRGTIRSIVRKGQNRPGTDRGGNRRR